MSYRENSKGKSPELERVRGLQERKEASVSGAELVNGEFGEVGRVRSCRPCCMYFVAIGRLVRQ